MTSHRLPRSVPYAWLILAFGLLQPLAACHGPEVRPAEAAESVRPGAWKPEDPRWGWLKFEQVGVGKSMPLLPVPGRVAPEESALWSVQAPLDGRVEQVMVRVGQPVKAGQPLAQVRSTGLADLRHDLTLSRQTEALRSTTLEHMEILAKANAVAGKDLMSARQDLRGAQLDRSTLERKVAALNVEATGDATYLLRAPHAGVIVKADVVPGAQVGPGAAPLMQLARLDRLIVWAQVPESDVDGISVGDTAEVRPVGRGDRVTRARVAAISKAVDPDLHTLGIRLTTEEPVAWLFPNGYVQVTLERHEARAIVVPAEAIVTDDLQSVAFVKRPDGHLEKRQVSLGRRTPKEVEVVKGLRPGERLVTKGAILVLNEVSP